MGHTMKTDDVDSVKLSFAKNIIAQPLAGGLTLLPDGFVHGYFGTEGMIKIDAPTLPSPLPFPHRGFHLLQHYRKPSYHSSWHDNACTKTTK